MIERFISGSLAGATAQTSIYPMEVSKTRPVSTEINAQILVTSAVPNYYVCLYSIDLLFQNHP